jgi:predicted RecA/RadA family phage recombinase
MATNEVLRDADHITLPVVSGVVSGEVVVVGALVGVAQTTRDATTGTATVWRKGAYRVTAAAATYAVGDAIYGHATGGGAVTARVGLIDKTSTTGTLIGYALEAKTLGAPGELVIALVQV